MPQDRQTKRYQSIEPVRTTLYNEKNKYQLRKIAEGLNDFNIVRVNNNTAAGGGSIEVDNSDMAGVMSPKNTSKGTK